MDMTSLPAQDSVVVEEGPDHRILQRIGYDGREVYITQIKKTEANRLHHVAQRAGITSLRAQHTHEDARQEHARYRQETKAAQEAEDAVAAAAPRTGSRRSASGAKPCRSARASATAATALQPLLSKQSISGVRPREPAHTFAAVTQSTSQHSLSGERPCKSARTSAAASPATAPANAAPPMPLHPLPETPSAIPEDAVTHSLTGSILKINDTYSQATDMNKSSRIQLGKLLGRGGFACVYLGKILQLGDSPAPTAAAAEAASADVAVKVYVASAAGCDAEQLQGYASTELQALSTLQRQEAVVQLLATAVLDPADAASSGQSAADCAQRSQHAPFGSNCNARSSRQGAYLHRCLVLEYLPKGAVSTVPFKCPEEFAKALLRPVLRTMKVMHSGDLGVRIIHRDIKPENLLLRVPKPGRGVELVLADFGCSFVEGKPKLKQPGIAGMRTCIGTPYYQAPELTSAVGLAAAAAAGGLTASIDCYSFGVTVMQLLHCLTVHEGLDVQEVQQKVVEFVDAPGDDAASTDVREFVGCCCGVGRIRKVAEANGEAARMTAAQLLETAWMRL